MTIASSAYLPLAQKMVSHNYCNIHSSWIHGQNAKSNQYSLSAAAINCEKNEIYFCSKATTVTIIEILDNNECKMKTMYNLTKMRAFAWIQGLMIKDAFHIIGGLEHIKYNPSTQKCVIMHEFEAMRKKKFGWQGNGMG